MSDESVCRRCSECEGQHHWIEDSIELAGREPWVGYSCKHCAVVADACDDCNDPAPIRYRIEDDEGGHHGFICETCWNDAYASLVDPQTKEARS